MRHPRPALAGLAIALATLVAAPACGEPDTSAAAAEVGTIPESMVPAELGGMAVAPEDVAVVKETKRPFVDAVGLYSLRRDDLLQATLQISRFTEDSKADTAKFRNGVVSQLGSTTPRVFRMGDQQVYLTTGRRQSVAVWWKDRYLFILSSREEFETPRALLRAALEIEP